MNSPKIQFNNGMLMGLFVLLAITTISASARHYAHVSSMHLSAHVQHHDGAALHTAEAVEESGDLNAVNAPAAQHLTIAEVHSSLAEHDTSVVAELHALRHEHQAEIHSDVA